MNYNIIIIFIFFTLLSCDNKETKNYNSPTIKSKLKIPLNLEMAPTKEMVKIAKEIKPKYVCIVPEKRSELTTEGGLNLKKKYKLKKIVSSLKRKKIRVSLFIEPNISDVKMSKYLGADCVELHTGKYCNLYNNNKKTNFSLNQIKKAAKYANMINLEVHAGHGLTYKTTYNLSKIDEISEFNIGHFIVSESLFIGLDNAVKKFKKIIKV